MNSYYVPARLIPIEFSCWLEILRQPVYTLPLVPSLAASAKLISPTPSLWDLGNLLYHFRFSRQMMTTWSDHLASSEVRRTERDITYALEKGEVCTERLPCYFTFLLTVRILFPGICMSTLPNKARYLWWSLFISGEDCRLLFLVIITAMEKFPFKEMEWTKWLL